MATIETAVKTRGKSDQPRTDIRAMWWGVGFAFVFTAIIFIAGPLLDPVRATLLPDQGPSWYYWKLAEPTAITRLSVWGLYAAHQVIWWGLIWYAQRRVTKYTAGLHGVNVAALGVNALFVVLHFVQTHIWYDGLAQDVSIFSSQGSVILMLIWIMLMENNRRGAIVGKRLPIGKRVISFARKYHGYVFAWAICYTFWYHPMETTNGHLLGFFYTFLLIVQGSLFLTRIHVNKWWMLAQEIIVLAHGTIVAIVQGNNLWPMFFFGFFGVFILVQMHGLGLSNRVKWLIFAVYAIGAAVVYIQPERGITKVWQLVAIPGIYYIVMIVLALLIAIGIWAYDRIRGKGAADPTPIGTGD
ncbi:MAG: hypothetical protein LCI00_32545 [Chloroflexi bacterium]|nr:hypothetical protein [Chloroflexota bacterium]MCC6894670.1 hypothetical protein [Anaerolineae bacterium]